MDKLKPLILGLLHRIGLGLSHTMLLLSVLGSFLFVILKVASVEVPLFVTFHFINAYEERDEEGRLTAIIADCCEHHADTTILDKLRLQNLRSFSGQDVLPNARYNFHVQL